MDEVIWKPIDSNDGIYNTNYLTIRSYIEGLKQEYMDKTCVSKEICDKEFNKNCPGLNQFVSLLEKCDAEIWANSSLANMISFNNSTHKFETKVSIIKETLKNFKMPHYQRKNSNIDKQLNIDTIPTNVSSMLRELYLQRIAVEAISKQRILEEELKSVVAILKSVAPSNLDLRSLIPSYDNIDNLSIEFGQKEKQKTK